MVLRYLPFGAAGGWPDEEAEAGCHGVGLAGSPTFAFWMPDTTTWSPACRPVRTTHLLPDVPPLASLYPGYESTNWYAVVAPAGTPEAIVSRISQGIARAIRLPDVREFMA